MKIPLVFPHLRHATTTHTCTTHPYTSQWNKNAHSPPNLPPFLSSSSRSFHELENVHFAKRHYIHETYTCIHAQVQYAQKTLGCINKNMNNKNKKRTCRYTDWFRGGEKGEEFCGKQPTWMLAGLYCLLFNVLSLRRTGFKILTDFIRLNTIAANGLELWFQRGAGCKQNRAGGQWGRWYDSIGLGGGTRVGMWVFKMNDLFCCTDWYHFLCKKKMKCLVVTLCLDTIGTGW